MTKRHHKALVSGDTDSRVYVNWHGKVVCSARGATPNRRVRVFGRPGRCRKPCLHG